MVSGSSHRSISNSSRPGGALDGLGKLSLHERAGDSLLKARGSSVRTSTSSVPQGHPEGRDLSHQLSAVGGFKGFGFVKRSVCLTESQPRDSRAWSFRVSWKGDPRVFGWKARVRRRPYLKQRACPPSRTLNSEHPEEPVTLGPLRKWKKSGLNRSRKSLAWRLLSDRCEAQTLANPGF